MHLTAKKAAVAISGKRCKPRMGKPKETTKTSPLFRPGNTKENTNGNCIRSPWYSRWHIPANAVTSNLARGVFNQCTKTKGNAFLYGTLPNESDTQGLEAEKPSAERSFRDLPAKRHLIGNVLSGDV